MAFNEPIVEEKDGLIYVGGNPNELTESWLIVCSDASNLCKLSRRTMQLDDCVACQVMKIIKRLQETKISQRMEELK